LLDLWNFGESQVVLLDLPEELVDLGNDVVATSNIV
jgi:hypothetical protein